jgi:beta-xylosidase
VSLGDSALGRYGWRVVLDGRPVSRRAFLGAGATVTGLVIAGGVSPAAAAAVSPGDGVRLATDPAYRGDFPDPFVLRVGKRYYAYATQTGAVNVQVMRSSDRVTWTKPRDALPDLPEWAGWGHTWAPAVLPRGQGYVLYYTVRHRASGRQAVSVATATSPDGPFADVSSGPLIFQLERGGSIDPSPFVDDDGTAYLLWKSDDNALGRVTSLWGSRLHPDGLSLTGRTYQLASQDAAWEAPVIEAPALIRVADRYYLFYGGGWWESEQASVGYATAEAPLGPYVKATRNQPWVASRPKATGPGGAEFFTDADGQVWMAYHAWEPGRVGYAVGGARSLWIDRVGFTEGGPILGLKSTSGR